MKYEMRAYPMKCVGCLNCQLICSFLYERGFNVFKARIVIDRFDDGRSKIGFTEKCNGCGFCADYCLYGTLEKVKAEESD